MGAGVSQGRVRGDARLKRGVLDKGGRGERGLKVRTE